MRFPNQSALLNFIAGLLILISLASMIWTLKTMEGQTSRRVGTALQAVLDTTHEALSIWREQTITSVSFIADSEEMRRAVDSLLQSGRDRSALARSPALDKIRRLMRDFVAQHGYTDFAVIPPDGVQIASGLDEFLGEDALKKRDPATIANALRGVAGLGAPLRSPSKQQKRSRVDFTILAAAPIFDESRHVVAALVLRMDPTQEFSPITRLGRLGRTGETYVFDRQGRLLSPSRFEAELGQTRPGAAASRGESGIDLEGYPDYRGVPVWGAWVWDEELGLGLATEMDAEEASGPLKTLWRLALVMFGTIAVAVLLLLRVVAHRGRLQAANFGYQQALKARQDILAIVAHDLKNPINSIVLSSSLLMKSLKSANPDLDSAKNGLEMTHRAAFRMNRLIEDLLLSARIDAGQLRVSPQECDLQIFLRDFEQLVHPLATEKSIEFVCSVEPSLEKAFVDPDRLSQILTNLIANAIKFSPVHGAVSLSVSRSNNQILFRVKDSGPGIAPAELPHVFDQYWQAKHGKPGAGLGLYICKGLVEAHGGKIWIETGVGEGTTVCFTIPAVKPATLAA